MKREGAIFWLLAAITIVGLSCGLECAARNADAASAAPQDSLPELALPKVPSTLTTAEDRAAYIILHFWDAMDFRDTLLSRNRSFMEQNIVNCLSLFPLAKQESLPEGIDALLEGAAADSVAFSLVYELSEQYLDEPYSPMRNEEYYILFLEGVLRLPGLSEEARLLPAFELEAARKNRSGTLAADFTYTDRNGKRQTLHGTQGKRLLLLFYDPTCSHCKVTMRELHDSPLLSGLIAKDELTVLAVYTESNRELWDETKDSMPQEWLVGIDESDIVENELYILPAMPVIYLLDSDKTVLMKDPTPTDLEKKICL